MSLNAVIVYILFLLLISVYGMVRFKNLTIPFRYLVIVIFITFLSEACGRVLAVKIRNSCPPYHFLCILQYAGFSLIFSALINNDLKKRLINYAIIPFALLSITNTLFFQHLMTIPTNMIMLSYIIFIIYALILFLQMLNEPTQTAIFKQGVFWFNCAILIYSVVISICIGAISYLIEHKLLTFPLHIFIYYVTVLYYLTLGISVYLDDKRDKAVSA